MFFHVGWISRKPCYGRDDARSVFKEADESAKQWGGRLQPDLHNDLHEEVINLGLSVDELADLAPDYATRQGDG